MVYTVLGSVLTPNITASVANRYAGKNILQMPFLGTPRPKPPLFPLTLANTLFEQFVHEGTAMVAGYNLPTLDAGDSVVRPRTAHQPCLISGVHLG